MAAQLMLAKYPFPGQLLRLSTYVCAKLVFANRAYYKAISSCRLDELTYMSVSVTYCLVAFFSMLAKNGELSHVDGFVFLRLQFHSFTSEETANT